MNVDFSEGSRGGTKRMLFWEAGKVSPRDLEFSPGLRAIPDKFGEFLGAPLTATAHHRGSAGPGKVKSAAGFPTKCPGLL